MVSENPDRGSESVVGGTEAMGAEEALTLLNQLRSNVIATQSASWSNLVYPLVAILNAAGYEIHGTNEDAREEHRRTYGGAGNVPSVLTADLPYERPSTMGDRFDNVVAS